MISRDASDTAAPARRVAWLVVDGLLYVGLLYKGVEAALLGVDGVIPRVVGFAALAAAVAVAVGLFAVGERRIGLRPSRERLRGQVLWTVLFAAAPVALALSPAEKGFTNVWLPLEWHKVGENLKLMIRISPAWGVVAAALVVIVARSALGARLATRALASLVLLGWAAFTTELVLHHLGSNKVRAYLVVFVLPLVLGAAASLAARPRWAVRFATGAGLASLILYHYVGVLPLFYRAAPERLPGFTRVYPAAGAEPDFLLAYMRELVLSGDGRYVFTCYGPSSGLARIELATGAGEVREVHGLARYLYAADAEGLVYTMDWDRGDFLRFRQDPFELAGEPVDILEDRRIAPWAFAVTDRHVFITFHEFPVLAKYDRATLAFEAERDMKRAGLTRFNSGLLQVIEDPRTGHLVAELGMTDRHDRFLLVEVEPERLEVVATAVLPDGGLDLALVPPSRTVIVPSFFSNRFHEMSLEPLGLTRTFHGPRNSRNVVFDPRRRLLYATSFLDGELWAMPYDDPERPVRRDRVGRKAQSLLLAPDGDTLFVGSSLGLFRVDLDAWLARPERS